jgi:hypothetical protein
MTRPLIMITLVGVAMLAQAQQPAGVPAPAASAASVPAPAKPARRPLTPEELRNTAQFPDGSQPERPVSPQVVVPFGRKPGPQPETPASGAATVPGKINDQVARCKALAEPHRQSACVHAPAASDATGR